MTEQTLTGWRAFALGMDGRLVAPFAARYWPDLDPDHAWPRDAVARCLTEDHPAPDPDCSCGYRATVVLSGLLKALAQPFAGSERSILDECGVLAEVELSGRILPGVDIPRDDPPMTSRGERARLVSSTWPRSTPQRKPRSRPATASPFVPTPWPPGLARSVGPIAPGAARASWPTSGRRVRQGPDPGTRPRAGSP